MTPDWVAMGSTVFFIMVSLPAVTDPVVQWREAEMPMACWICSAVRPSIRPATMGEAAAVRVAWCQPISRTPGKLTSHRRCSNS